MPREYQPQDAKLLAQFGAPLENDAFRALYFRSRDVWNRLHTSGNAEMNQVSLHGLVFQWELAEDSKVKPAKAKEKAA